MQDLFCHPPWLSFVPFFWFSSFSSHFSDLNKNESSHFPMRLKSSKINGFLLLHVPWLFSPPIPSFQMYLLNCLFHHIECPLETSTPVSLCTILVFLFSILGASCFSSALSNPLFSLLTPIPPLPPDLLLTPLVLLKAVIFT